MNGFNIQFNVQQLYNIFIALMLHYSFYLKNVIDYRWFCMSFLLANV